jgi:phosphoribosylanthranilate isomerase
MKFRENISAVAHLQPDFMGFIFYQKSPRYAANNLVAQQLFKLDSGIGKVIVFVNEDLQTIKRVCAEFKIKIVQLHGKESPELCASLKEDGFTVIKAFGVDQNFDFSDLNCYSDCCDYFLFDTKTIAHGGSGKSFNWELLKKYQINIPYFLSGGISLDHLDEIMNLKDKRLYAIDVNSGFEIEPGLKDINALQVLINRIRNEF